MRSQEQLVAAGCRISGMFDMFDAAPATCHHSALRSPAAIKGVDVLGALTKQ